ncbi:MAG: RHS repeat-associated core domain-containing protein [Planctomycetota bacterium]
MSLHDLCSLQLGLAARALLATVAVAAHVRPHDARLPAAATTAAQTATGNEVARLDVTTGVLSINSVRIDGPGGPTFFSLDLLLLPAAGLAFYPIAVTPLATGPATSARADLTSLTIAIPSIEVNGTVLVGKLAPLIVQPVVLWTFTEIFLQPPSTSQLVDQVDLEVPDRGFPLQFSRQYSLESDFAGPLGYGWSHPFLMEVQRLSQDLIQVVNNDGTLTNFTRTGAMTFGGPPGDRRILRETSSNFELQDDDATIVFDISGRLDRIEDRHGNALSMAYDASDRLQSVSGASGQVMTIVYDFSDRIISVTDPAGRVVRYTYDPSGNLATVTDAAGGVTVYAYDSYHDMRSVTDAAGRAVSISTNDYGLVETIRATPGGASWTVAYGSPGPDSYTIIDQQSTLAVVSYDSRRLITRVTRPGESPMSFTWDSDRNLTSITDQNGSAVTASYGALGELLSLTDPLGNVTTLTYVSGTTQLATWTDAGGNTTSQTYDANGNLASRTHPDGTAETWAYDSFGQVASRDDRTDRTTTFARDARGLMTSKTYPDGTSVRYTYGATGLVLSGSDETGTFSFTRDTAGRITATSDPNGCVVLYAFDATGRRVSMTHPDGLVVDYAYDPLGRVLSIAERGVGSILDYTWDSRTRRTSRSFGNGTSTIYSYDAYDRITRIAHVGPSAVSLSSFDYTFDAAGNALSEVSGTASMSFGYDANGQLVSVGVPGGSVTTHAYDALGNRTAVIGSSTTSYVVNNLNQYVSAGAETFTYDANGNLASRTGPSGTTTYRYDFEDRLVQVSGPANVVDYTYDPFGRLVSRTASSVTTHFVYDGFRLIAEVDSQGANVARYHYGRHLDEVVAMDREGQRYFFHHDRRGSVRAVSGPGGQLIESMDYDAFGAPAAGSSIANPFLFGARYFDPQGRLYYLRARFYDPRIGRFLSPDPGGFVDGSNMYVFVGNNPINLRDPDGRAGTGLSCLDHYNHLKLSEAYGDLVGKVFGDAGEKIGKMFEFWAKPGWVMYEPLCGDPDNGPPPADRYPGDEIPGGASPGGGGSASSTDPTFLQASSTGEHRGDVLGQSSELFGRISIPTPNALVRAHVPICGICFGEDFASYRVEYGAGSDPTDWVLVEKSDEPRTEDVSFISLNATFDTPVFGNLATWDTGLTSYVYPLSHPEGHPVDLRGTYTVRLVVTGKDGSFVEDRVVVQVANVLTNARGGTVKSDDGAVTLVVPEHALTEAIRLVGLTRVEREGEVPALPAGVDGVSAIYAAREAGETFLEPATLRFAVPGSESGRAVSLLAFDGRRGDWLSVPHTRAAEDAIVAEIDALLQYYVLVTGLPPKARIEPGSPPSSPARRARGGTVFHLRETFDNGVGGWRNRHGRYGASVSLDGGDTRDGDRCLSISNEEAGGSFAVDAGVAAYDLRDYPLVRFDYRIPEGVALNFVVRVDGRWFTLGFTDAPDDTRYRDVNLCRIGAVEDVRADGAWHTARVDLYQLLRERTGGCTVEAIGFADWNVSGFMRLDTGSNPAGATFWIDNFVVARDPHAGFRLPAEDFDLVDFDVATEVNWLGGEGSQFTSDDGAKCEVDVVDSTDGKALRMHYDVRGGGQFGGVAMDLLGVDLRDHAALEFRYRVLDGAGFEVGLSDTAGEARLVTYAAPEPAGAAAAWHTATIPLCAFGSVDSLRAVEHLTFSAVHPRQTVGVVEIDDVRFVHRMRECAVADFDGGIEWNSLSGASASDVVGNASLGARQVRDDEANGALALSFGGLIGFSPDVESGSWASWHTDLRGVDVSAAESLIFRIRGVEGGERPRLYLDDGNTRWGMHLAEVVPITKSWSDVVIPLTEFARFGVDLTHLQRLTFSFEWERMSGTVLIDDIRFGTAGSADSR